MGTSKLLLQLLFQFFLTLIIIISSIIIIISRAKTEETIEKVRGNHPKFITISCEPYCR